VTLTSLNAGGGTVGTATAGTVDWDPVAGAHDPAGNPMSATPVTSSGAPF
jgi:hypothetical protein